MEVLMVTGHFFVMAFLSYEGKSELRPTTNRQLTLKVAILGYEQRYLELIT